jgi:hypothetical protein
MKKSISYTLFAIVISMVFIGCFNSTNTKTKSYEEIPVGYSEKELIRDLGDPHENYVNIHGEKIYKYVEIISDGDQVLLKRSFYFTIKDGKVIKKSVSSPGEEKSLE